MAHPSGVDQPLLSSCGVSRKLLIVVVVQSALVLGLGGAALGVSMSGPSEPAAHAKGKKKKVKAPPPDEAEHEAASEDEGEHEPAPTPGRTPKKKATKVAEAHADDPEAHKEPAPGPEAEKPAPPPPGPKGSSDKAAAAHGSGDTGAPVPSKSERPALETTPKEPLEAFAWLDEGNARWAQGVSRTRDVARLRAALAKGFAPWALVVSCGDGRVVPEAVFDAAPGALATLKAPVLKADAAFASSVELGVRKYGAKVVVLLGHEGCDDGSGRAVEEQVTALASRVMSKKALRDQARAGKLLVLRATYGLESGRVKWLDSEEAAHDESAHR